MAAAQRVAVIGGGPSGMSSVRSFRAQGFETVLFEQGEDFGGLWNWQEPSSAAYATTQLISSRTATEFPERPMPADWPDYPGIDQVRDYLRACARDWGLYEHARFGSRVTSAVPGDGGWRLEVEHGGQAEQLEFDAIVVAVGRYNRPRMPDFPGTFSGTVMHSKEFVHPDQLRGQRVLVVGAGNTGCDIAIEASRVGASAHLSMRRGYWFVPKYLFGKPFDQALALPLPVRLRRHIDAPLLRLLVGDMRRLGLPAPTHKLYDCIPIVSADLQSTLGHGKLAIKPNVARLDGDTVHFVDGTHEEFDLVVYATGYDPEYPFLDRALLNWPEGAREPDLWLNQFHPGRDDLFVLGLTEALGGGWPTEALQARAAAAALAARDRHPDRALAFAQLKRRPEPDLSGGLSLGNMHYDHDKYLCYIRGLGSWLRGEADAPGPDARRYVARPLPA